MSYGNSYGGGQAFSSGLMAGFGFVENIANNRRQLKLQEEALKQREEDNKRADQYLKLATDRDQRELAAANEKHKIESRVRLFDAVASPLVSKVKTGGLKSLTPEERRKWDLIGDQDAGIAAYNQAEYAQQNAFEVQDRAVRLQEAANARERARQEAGLEQFAQAFAPQQAAPTEQPGAPRLSLQDVMTSGAPRQLPGPLAINPGPKAGFGFPSEDDQYGEKTGLPPAGYTPPSGPGAEAKKFWGTAISTKADGAALRAELAKDPSAYTDRYYRERGTLSESERALADKEMTPVAMAALAEAQANMNALPVGVDPKSPEFRRAKSALDRHSAVLRNITSEYDTLAEAGVRGNSFPVGNAELASRVEHAVRNQPIDASTPSPASVKAVSTQLDRIEANPPTRANGAQLKAVIRGISLGFLPKEALTNFLATGQIVKRDIEFVKEADGYTYIVDKTTGARTQDRRAPRDMKRAAENEAAAYSNNWGANQQKVVLETFGGDQTRANDFNALLAQNVAFLEQSGVPVKKFGLMDPLQLSSVIKRVDEYLSVKHDQDTGAWDSTMISIGLRDPFGDKAGQRFSDFDKVGANVLDRPVTPLPKITISPTTIARFKEAAMDPNSGIPDADRAVAFMDDEAIAELITKRQAEERGE